MGQWLWLKAEGHRKRVQIGLGHSPCQYIHARQRHNSPFERLRSAHGRWRGAQARFLRTEGIINRDKTRTYVVKKWFTQKICALIQRVALNRRKAEFLHEFSSKIFNVNFHGPNSFCLLLCSLEVLCSGSISIPLRSCDIKLRIYLLGLRRPLFIQLAFASFYT